ncbi:MAG: S41 family peptidase [Desulfuromonadales bacterium]|nr:S41 family peptidase [Desulfuromonadales bacterium]MBN2793390.1 S41 family peptidase [Desulfuromonadales bacterium]
MDAVKRLKVYFLAMLIVMNAGYAFCRQSSVNQADDYKNLEIFTDVLSLIRNSYVEDVQTQDLIYGAINGMLQTLDPHSSFLTPEMYEDMQADTHGEFGGLGIEITIKDHSLIVVSPIEDTPAYRAGIKAGDRIVKINDQLTQDIEIMQAVRLMRGPQGDPVTLTIERAGEKNLLVFTIVRAIIQIESVKSRLLEGHYGYVRLSQFQDRSAQDLKNHLQRLGSGERDSFSGLILDLRNNPGGLLDQAVAVADLFLEEGLIVYTEGRDEEAQLKFAAKKAETEPGYPLIVLINGGSASAAEIVAGALQDHGRAIVLGEQSFGKGSVQTIIPLGDDSGLRLTTARYFTPSGRSIQARGITPDIVVAPLIPQLSETSAPLREKDLENHFEAETDTSGESSTSFGETEDSAEDNQLNRALELLKGYEILQHSTNKAA